MKILKTIRLSDSKGNERSLFTLVLTWIFVFLLCLNSYAGDAEDLRNAAEKGDISTLATLLAKGADVNAKGIKYGWTALMWASREGHLDIVQALLDKGANVNEKANDGLTALMAASREGHLDIVQALLAKGADVNAKTNDGWTALNLAKEKEHSDVAQLLIKSGAKQLLGNDGKKRTDILIHIIGGIIGIVGGILLMISLKTRKSKRTQWGTVALACAAGLTILWGILVLTPVYGHAYFAPRTLSIISQCKTSLGGMGVGILFTLLLAKQI